MKDVFLSGWLKLVSVKIPLLVGAVTGIYFNYLELSNQLHRLVLAIGIERLHNAIKLYHPTFFQTKLRQRVLVLPLKQQSFAYAYEIVHFLQQQHIAVSYDFSLQSFRTKLKNKRHQNYHYWIIVGEQEAQERTWSLKNQVSGVSLTCSWTEGLAKLQTEGNRDE